MEDSMEDLRTDLVVDTKVMHTKDNQTMDIRREAIDDPSTLEVKTANNINILATATVIFIKEIISTEIMTEEISIEHFSW